MKKSFPKEQMLELLDERETKSLKLVSDTITSNSRWSIIHTVIFSEGDKFYSCCYSVGATEYQDERAWEYDDTVDCTEVRPVEKTIIVYEPVDKE